MTVIDWGANKCWTNVSYVPAGISTFYCKYITKLKRVDWYYDDIWAENLSKKSCVKTLLNNIGTKSSLDKTHLPNRKKLTHS